MLGVSLTALNIKTISHLVYNFSYIMEETTITATSATSMTASKVDIRIAMLNVYCRYNVNQDILLSKTFTDLCCLLYFFLIFYL